MRKRATRRSPSQYKKPIAPTQNFLPSVWSAVQSPWVIFFGVLGFLGYKYASAPDVKRPIYNSRDECLADWANSPQDCQTSGDSSSGGFGRRWYGPWVDNQGVVYHEDGTRSQRMGGMATSHFSGSTRLGFGGSSGHSRAG